MLSQSLSRKLVKELLLGANVEFSSDYRLLKRIVMRNKKESLTIF